MFDDPNVVLHCEQIEKIYPGTKALDHVSFDVLRGKVNVLIGENGAGKSTLMKIIAGIEQPSGGKLYMEGQEVSFKDTSAARAKGIGIIHQELSLFPNLTIAQNIYMNHEKKKGPFVDNAAHIEGTKKVLARLQHQMPPNTQVGDLRVGQQQMVEIARNLVEEDLKILIMDEPTSSLMTQEVEKLFAMMRMLKEQGISLIYISHKMDEIFEICDEISVLRDGKLVMTKRAEDTNMNELIAAMVGRSLESRFPPVDNTPGETILSVQHLSTKYAPYLQDVSFDVREGEIFGLYGLVGAGRTELLETIFGVRTRAAGRVYFKGRLMNFTNAREAIEHGFAMITEERKANGLFLKCDLTFNTTIANLNQYKSGPALSNPKMVKATNKEIKVMRTKCMGPDDMITSLSGGNQQKVIFGKWLEREPQVFMMDEPTRGIDVGAKYEIYELIIQMAKAGKTIIVVSSEMPEILGITNRIGVMSNGHLSGIVNTKETDQEELLRLSAKYL